MIREALRRLHVRLFGRPATSVSPKIVGSGASAVIITDRPSSVITTPAALDRVEEAAQRLYGEPNIDPFPWDNDGRATAIKHLKRPAAGIKPPDAWTWEAWAKEFSSLAIDGWAPCQFAHRAGLGAEKAVFVFGVVRGDFGLWQQPFDVCVINGLVHQSQTDVLTIATHLRSGIGMGIFATKTDAAQACNLASRVAPWSTIDHEDRAAWVDAARRTCDAWHEFGIVASVNAYAHDRDTDSGPMPIMGLSIESASEGKPEKLS